jgi:hypothetical protein
MSNLFIIFLTPRQKPKTTISRAGQTLGSLEKTPYLQFKKKP